MTVKKTTTKKKVTKKKAGVNRGGRPTKEQAIKKRIEKAENPETLKLYLDLLRVRMIERISEDSLEVENNKNRAEDVKALYQLWRSGKDVYDDLVREINAKQVQGKEMGYWTALGDDVVDELGWDE